MTTSIPAENLTSLHRIANYSNGKAAQVEAVSVDDANGIVTAHVKVAGRIGTTPVVFAVGEPVTIA